MDNNRIVRAITSVTCVMLLVKLLGMVRNILQARQFGAGADVDVFTLANNYSVSLFTTICYALCIAAIPIFSQKLLESRRSCYETADTLISNTLILSLLVLGGLLLLGTTGATELFLGEQAQGELFRFCFLVLVPALPVIMLTYLLLALFQPMGHFNLQGSLSLLYNAALCAALVAGGEKLSLKTFTVLTSVCWLFQLAIVLPCIKKEQYHFHFRPNLRQRSYWSFLRTGMLTMYNSAVFLLCYLINAHFATAAPTGTVASYFYADRLYEPLATALIYSVSIVLFPSFSQKYTQMEHREYRQYVVYILKNALLFLLPVSLLFAAFGTPVIRVLFEGGDFSAQNALVCGSILHRDGWLFCAGYFEQSLLCHGEDAHPHPDDLRCAGGVRTVQSLGEPFSPGAAGVAGAGQFCGLLLGGACWLCFVCSDGAGEAAGEAVGLGDGLFCGPRFGGVLAV